MARKTIGYMLLLPVLTGITLSARSDEVIPDNAIVQGSVCVGFDCGNRVNFRGDAVQLRENNLRVRFHDTSVPNVLGQSWNLAANSQVSGGPDFFQFELKTITGPILSDGTAPRFDCSRTDPDTGWPPLVGTIAEGEFVVRPVRPSADGAWICHSVDSMPVLDFGTGAPGDRAVTLGYDSLRQPGAVSLGRDGLLRRLKHVAEGIADPDGDSIRYQVTVCEQADFSGCDPVEVSAAESAAPLVQLGAGSAGLLLLVGALAPAGSRRRRRPQLRTFGLLAVITAAVLLGGCTDFPSSSADGGGTPNIYDSERYVVSGLNSGSTYYWKVAAEDFLDSSESSTQAFSVQ